MIGINLGCVSFCGACWAYIIYCKIKSLTAEIIFADENLIHRLYIGFEGLLSQMNNSVGFHKILVCESVGRCLACE